ncbi:MAG: MBL fold metallo-hydrolase [Spirochaetes bacterium]|nr:MBL fold metallo-hydrolase [Spirochaetota bacterium]
MKLSFYGAAGSVTGSCFLLETEGKNILIDCGMFQGKKELRNRNEMDFPFNPGEIDAVIITHAHIDHTGLLPKLVKYGFKNKIFLTKATCDLAEILLYDSQKIQAGDAEWKNRKRKRQGLKPIEPLYDEKDVDNTLKLFNCLDYHKNFNPVLNINAVFMDAGHIMGSGFLILTVRENNIYKKIIFSGDIGRPNQAIIKDPEVSTDADIILLESTYGNRIHKIEADTNKELVSILDEVRKEKGVLLIPAFAVGRTQEMIYRFFELYQKHNIEPVDIYIDSPMAAKVTRIYEKHKELYDSKSLEYLQKGDNPLSFEHVHLIESVDDSIKLNKSKGPLAIISASGMCDSGRITHHLKHHLWKSNTHVVFVGYQAAGTLGRLLVDGAKKVKIHGETIEVKAKIHTVGGLSAHADREQLISWLKFYEKRKPQTFLIHGEPEVCREFSENITKKFNLKTYIPEWGDTAEIIFKEKEVEISFKKKAFKIKFEDEKAVWLDSVNQINNIIKEWDKYDLKKKAALEEILKGINDFIKENINNNIK